MLALAVLSISAASGYSTSESDPVAKRKYFTKKVSKEQAPQVDGLLTDESWNAVEWQGDFIELRPDENTAPTHQTRFKVLYDNKNLYVGIQAFDSEPDNIEKRLGRRDEFPGDLIEVNIDSYHDLRTGFSFTVSASGVIGDEFISNDGRNWDGSWNPIWYSKTNIDNEGWTAELKIPLSQLRFGKDKDQVWGFQVMRHIFDAEERSVWQRIPQGSNGFVSQLGELHGLVDLEPQKQIEIQPYATTQVETYPAEAGDPFRDGNDFKLSGGLDGKIGITNNLTMDFTINPDFGQVEADPAAITLDGFQLFFNERRPFFVENKNIFNYRFSQTNSGNTFGNDNLFYSRRIGRSPHGYPSTESGEYVDQPHNTTILGAAKFSGKTKNGWSIGVLESVTAKEFAEIDNNGERREELVEPLTNYFVGRLQKDFNDSNTIVGGIFTATNRNLNENLDFLHKSAYSGGVDFKHQWNNRKWYITGNAVLSHVQGSKEAITETQESIRHLFQRVDNGQLDVDPNKTSLTGTGGNIQFGKGSGDFVFEGGMTWRSPELELNDLGFQRQADDLRHNFWMGYRWRKPHGIYNNIGVNYNHFSTWDFEGNHNSLEWNINSYAQLKNYWFVNAGLNLRPRSYSNSWLQGGPRFRRGDGVSNWFGVGTDNRKRLRLNFDASTSFGQQDEWSSYDLGLGIMYRPNDAMSISLRPSYSSNKSKVQYVNQIDYNGQTRYVTANINQQTLAASIRLNYTLNPNLTIQYYGQPFISAGRYNDFNHVSNPLAEDLYDKITLYNQDQIAFDSSNDQYDVDENTDGTIDYSIGNPNFAFVQFRSNLVVRWEYLPGSEIFLVWSQGVTGFDDANNNLLRNLDNQILHQQIENIFLLKATYRFVL